jgi:hypothetical protein
LPRKLSRIKERKLQLILFWFGGNAELSSAAPSSSISSHVSQVPIVKENPDIHNKICLIFAGQPKVAQIFSKSNTKQTNEQNDIT